MSFNAFWYSGTTRSNISSFEEISDERLFAIWYVFDYRCCLVSNTACTVLCSDLV